MSFVPFSCWRRILSLSVPLTYVLTLNRYKAVGKQNKMDWTTRFVPVLIAALVPILIPVIQFGVIFRLWDKYNKPINKDLCSCSCWDTVFKGGYETGVGSYKHFYFNSNRNTVKIWTLTVFSVIALYEAVKYAVSNIVKSNQQIP